MEHQHSAEAIKQRLAKRSGLVTLFVGAIAAGLSYAVGVILYTFAD